MSPELLTPAQAARLLNVSEAMIRRWIRQGLMRWPAPDVHGVRRDELLEWARKHGFKVVDPTPGRAEPPDLLADAVERGAVTAGSPENAAEAIELVVRAVPGISGDARAKLLREVLDRERTAGTGLGRGVALPHPRRPPGDVVSEPVVTVAFLDPPVDWAALDEQPVFAALLPLSPDARIHLQLLARIAVVLRLPEFHALLGRHAPREELLACLRSIRNEP